MLHILQKKHKKLEGKMTRVIDETKYERCNEMFSRVYLQTRYFKNKQNTIEFEFGIPTELNFRSKEELRSINFIFEFKFRS